MTTAEADGDLLKTAWSQAHNAWQRHAGHNRGQAEIAAIAALRAGLAAAGPIDHAGEMMRLALEQIAQRAGEPISAQIASEALDALRQPAPAPRSPS